MAKAEFMQGIKHLNSMLDAGTEKLDGDALFDLCDLDRSGEVELDEFCECYRLYSALI